MFVIGVFSKEAIGLLLAFRKFLILAVMDM